MDSFWDVSLPANIGTPFFLSAVIPHNGPPSGTHSNMSSPIVATKDIWDLPDCPMNDGIVQKLPRIAADSFNNGAHVFLRFAKIEKT